MMGGDQGGKGGGGGQPNYSQMAGFAGGPQPGMQSPSMMQAQQQQNMAQQQGAYGGQQSSLMPQQPQLLQQGQQDMYGQQQQPGAQYSPQVQAMQAKVQAQQAKVDEIQGRSPQYDANNAAFTTPESAFYGLQPLTGQNLEDVQHQGAEGSWGTYDPADALMRRQRLDAATGGKAANYINAYEAGGPMYDLNQRVEAPRAQAALERKQAKLQRMLRGG
jgi:hypothetical protein